MRIAFVSPRDPHDVHSWSGLGYFMPRSLEACGAHVDYIWPSRNRIGLLNGAGYLWYTRIRGQNDHPHRDPAFLRHWARQIERQIAGSSADVVLAPGTLAVSAVETEKPLVIWSDCTFASLEDYYPKFSDLSKRTRRNGHQFERRVLQRCDRIIMSCQWAIDSCVDDYGLDRNRCHLIPFGANLEKEPTDEEIERIIAERRCDPCRLLFLSVDWSRKNGDLAFTTAQELHRRGHRIEFQVVGCEPPADVSASPFTTPLGFISKSSPEGQRQLRTLFEEATFLLLPSRADCTPVVYSEASAFGLPSLGTDTGGITSVVRNGVNGFTLAPQASPEDYADIVETHLRDREGYSRLCSSTRAFYSSTLSWSAAARKAMEVLELATRAAA